MATKKARKSVKKGKRLTTAAKQRAQQRITLQRRMHGGARGGLWG